MRGIRGVRQMLYQLFSDTPASVKIIFLLVLAATSYLIITYIGLLLALPLFSMNWDQLQYTISEGFQKSDTGFIYYLQGIQTLGIFIVPALLAHILLFEQGSGFIKDRSLGIGTSVFLSLIVLIVSAPILQWLIHWNNEIRFPDIMKGIESSLKKMENDRSAVTERLLSDRSIHVFLINILIVAALPALGEEFMFRGVLQKILISWFKNNHWGILVVAFCFSAFHLQFYGLIPRFLLGMFFGYLYCWSGTIWLPVLAHFLNNAIAISIAYISMASDSQIPALLTGNDNPTLPVLFVSFALTCILIICIRRYLLNLNREMG